MDNSKQTIKKQITDLFEANLKTYIESAQKNKRISFISGTNTSSNVTLQNAFNTLSQKRDIICLTLGQNYAPFLENVLDSNAILISKLSTSDYTMMHEFVAHEKFINKETKLLFSTIQSGNHQDTINKLQTLQEHDISKLYLDGKSILDVILNTIFAFSHDKYLTREFSILFAALAPRYNSSFLNSVKSNLISFASLGIRYYALSADNEDAKKFYNTHHILTKDTVLQYIQENEENMLEVSDVLSDMLDENYSIHNFLAMLNDELYSAMQTQTSTVLQCLLLCKCILEKDYTHIFAAGALQHNIKALSEEYFHDIDIETLLTSKGFIRFQPNSYISQSGCL